MKNKENIVKKEKEGKRKREGYGGIGEGKKRKKRVERRVGEKGGEKGGLNKGVMGEKQKEGGEGEEEERVLQE